MSFSKQLTQLGLLGTFTLAGLSACTTCHGYRASQSPCGPAPQTIVTASPPVTQTAPSTAPSTAANTAPQTPPGGPALTPPPPDETSPALPAAAAQGQAPATAAESGPGKPGDGLPPPPAPPAAPAAGSEPSAAISAPAAESNHDQLQTQKPLDTTTSAPAVADQPVAANAAPAPSANVTVTIPKASKAPPAQPGPLAKLRARFHNLIQPNTKPTVKATKTAKASGPAAAPQKAPQVVASVHIPLPLSDPNRVVQEDSRASHTILPGESQSPVSTGDARDAQPGTASANAVGFQVNQTNGQFGAGMSRASKEVEPWPYGPQAATSANKVPNTAATEEFDSIPVEEYKAAIVAANTANALPTFDHTAASGGQQAATTSSNAAVPQPMTAAPPNVELQVVPLAVPPQERPMLPQQQPQTVPTAAAGTAGPVAPAIQVLPANSADQSQPTAPRPVRPAQWIGGRYGQPAWMVPYLATPEGSAGQ